MMAATRSDVDQGARILLATGLALLMALVVAAPAAARIYRVPAALGGTLNDVRDETGLDILLPERIALDFDGTTFPSGYGGQRRYGLTLAGAPNCGSATACFLVTFSAERGENPHYLRTVKLRGGRTGYFKPLTCGGSCSPPVIEWRSRGVLYAIQANIPNSQTSVQRARLIRAANSAIGAGPR